ARICSPAAERFAKTVTAETGPFVQSLAAGLVALSIQLGPDEADRLCAPIAKLAAQEIMKNDPLSSALAGGKLAALTPALTPQTAAQMISTFYTALVKTSDPTAAVWLQQGISALTTALDAESTNRLATEFLQLAANNKDPLTKLKLSECSQAL